jgi:hypothetical protein
MNKEAWMGRSSAKFIYYSYKDSPYFMMLLFTVVFSVCLVLVFNVIVPQVESWFSIQAESQATQQRIDIINSNLEYVSLRLDKGALESDRQTVISALPVDKDFASIINAVTLSSAESGVVVDDFSFGIGPISSASAERSNSLIKGVDTIILSLSLKGGSDDVIAFIREIGEKLPLSEVDTVDTSENSSILSLVFFSKPYESRDIHPDQPIDPVKAENSTLLGEISKWSTGVDSFFEEVPPRSDTVPLF